MKLFIALALVAFSSAAFAAYGQVGAFVVEQQTPSPSPSPSPSPQQPESITGLAAANPTLLDAIIAFLKNAIQAMKWEWH